MRQWVAFHGRRDDLAGMVKRGDDLVVFTKLCLPVGIWPVATSVNSTPYIHDKNILLKPNVVLIPALGGRVISLSLFGKRWFSLSSERLLLRGAMDQVAGAKRAIVAMQHHTRDVL